MSIVIIVSIIVITGISLFLLSRWAICKKVRVFCLLALFGAILVSVTIHQLFFMKMEFVQSQIYPDLYLVKNPVDGKSIVYQSVRKKVAQEKENNEPTTLRFYEYTKGDWGENGTAYFMEHKERRDGMTAELLEYYPEYLIAIYSLQPCSKGQGYLEKLDYYNERKPIKTDTLLNSCK